MNTGASISTLPQLLLEQSRNNPDHLAVTWSDGSLSMEQLVSCSLAVANQLIEAGAKPGDFIAIFAEPSVEMEIGIWGILFSGCAYIPVSPDYTPDRLSYMFKDSKVKAVLCHKPTANGIMEHLPEGVQVVTIAAELADNPPPLDKSFEPKPSAEHPAYVIYTSGTTGKPKGVVITHRSITSQMQWLSTAYNIGPDTVILQKTLSSFDAAQWEILSPACGSTVVTGAPKLYMNRREMIQLVTTHQVTTLQCTPTLLNGLTDDASFAQCTSLKQIFCGGEAFTRALARKCHELMPQCQQINLYGPTECTINASSHTVDIDSLEHGASTIPIGLPVDGTSFYILDGDLAEVPKGDEGELYIGGVQVALGYLDRPELTEERFVDSPISNEGKLYKTGDIAYQNPDGTYQFVGRVDNQVKHRGYRIELESIASLATEHDWISNAAAVLKRFSDSEQEWSQLVLFVELDLEMAPLMDGGGAHHASKASGTQFKLQMTNPGRRDLSSLSSKPVIELEGKEPNPDQQQLAFARKTYRNHHGGEVSRDDILNLLSEQEPPSTVEFEELTALNFGAILRYLGQFNSHRRTLPKYSYASPGALYATQVYLEVSGASFIDDGIYYYDPVDHRLFLITNLSAESANQIKLHFIGKKSAIEPIYKNNIREVLEIETGHIVGVLEYILPRHGMAITNSPPEPDIINQLEIAPDDYYLGTFLVGAKSHIPQMVDATDVYVQAHGGKVTDLPNGQHEYCNGELTFISDMLIQKHDVIALNQNVYESSSFGISVVAKTEIDHMKYIDLGRKLQKIMMNNCGLGFMSSGYSSKTGNNLGSANRLEQILEKTTKKANPSYFFVGGAISQAQITHQGMDEDASLSKGPAEMLKEHLGSFLEEYAIPDRVEVVDRMPMTLGGKADLRELESRVEFEVTKLISPRTAIEKRIGQVWERVLGAKCRRVSVRDRFKEDMNGDSLQAVDLLLEIEEEFQFGEGELENKLSAELHTIEQWAELIGERLSKSATMDDSRRLAKLAHPRELYIWPGLGGTTNRLGELAKLLKQNARTVTGVEACGVNRAEAPYRSIVEMAVADIRMIRSVQTTGPYTLWGYSFGARVAFETAYQLEQRGYQVDELVLIAPGSPKVPDCEEAPEQRKASYDSKDFVSMLYSVFTGNLEDPGWSFCLQRAKDRQSFVTTIEQLVPGLKAKPGFTERIVELVTITYELNYTIDELKDRQIKAPITVFRTRGDQASFIERSAESGATSPEFVDIEARHYEVLQSPAVAELIEIAGGLGLGCAK